MPKRRLQLLTRAFVTLFSNSPNEFLAKYAPCWSVKVNLKNKEFRTKNMNTNITNLMRQNKKAAKYEEHRQRWKRDLYLFKFMAAVAKVNLVRVFLSHFQKPYLPEEISKRLVGLIGQRKVLQNQFKFITWAIQLEDSCITWVVQPRFNSAKTKQKRSSITTRFLVSSIEYCFWT